ncbi:VOC family protein [Actinocorallia longicatena]|uniref:VOC family protein n=1 Tax=Actinocorallia longicatena TaxID=111803 RepID=A0ABP6Q635_9ACTN
MAVLTGNAAPGTPNWVDLGIPDITRAKEFYRALLGWEYDDQGSEYGGYVVATRDGHPVAGLMGVQEAPSAWWGVYFATDDCDGTAKRVTDAGGSVVAAPMDVGPLGRMAIFQDAQGAQFGLWQAGEFAGSELVNAPGSFTWNELVTADSAAAARFYTGVLDVTAAPIEEGLDYQTLNVGDRPVCGVYGVPERELAEGGAGPHWTIYFAVDDADEAARIAVAQGGTVTREPADSSFGRVVVLKDPFGAEFAAIRIPEGQG